MDILNDFSLKKHNTFGIDAKARYYYEIRSFEDLIAICRSEVFLQNKHLVLGGGSNILFTQDYSGLVLNMQIKGIKVLEEDDDFVSVKVSGGEDWNEFVKFCCKNKWYGLENLAYIPGKAGSVPVQNVGAYGVEVKDCITYVDAYNIEEKEMQTFNNEDCKFSYRDSVFKHEGKGRFIIYSVTFKLSKKPVFNTSYGIIGEELERMNSVELDAEAIAKAITNIRKRKLPDPTETGSAGSFFKNPVISVDAYEKLKNLYPNMPAFNTEAHIKISAGWLIEHCGWKGFRRGDVGVYEHQALLLVNYGHATAQDIVALSDEIIQSVKAKFNITLEPEVNFV